MGRIKENQIVLGEQNYFKKKLIIFGAAEFIYNVALKTINFSNVEIVAFADNEDTKWGLCYDRKKVLSPQDLLKTEFDYILVGAWYSYSKICKQLVEIGIEEKKIMPLLETKHLFLLTGVITNLDSEVINEIFLEGQKLQKEIIQLNVINKRYEEVSAITDTNEKTDFSCYPLIAHACGGYVNGEKMEYTNSLEALQEALASGFHCFECDVWGGQNGKIILGSRLKMQWPIDINYTILTLDVLFKMIVSDIRNKVILDIKYNVIDDFYRILNSVEILVNELELEGYSNIRKQIIVETFDEVSTVYAKGKNWECIVTDYRNREGQWLKKTAIICCEHNIKTVLLDANFVIKNEKYVKYLLEKNIDIICYPVDDLKQYVDLKKIGITSVITNYLEPAI